MARSTPRCEGFSLFGFLKFRTSDFLTYRDETRHQRAFCGGGAREPGNPASGAARAGAWEGLREGPSHPLAGGRTEVRGETHKYGFPAASARFDSSPVLDLFDEPETPGLLFGRPGRGARRRRLEFSLVSERSSICGTPGSARSNSIQTNLRGSPRRRPQGLSDPRL